MPGLLKILHLKICKAEINYKNLTLEIGKTII